MKINYLTSDLKSYYLEDFQRLLTYDDSEFWDIDSGIQDILININTNQNVQTLYSKRYIPKKGNFDLECLSYLQLAYMPQAENSILVLLTNLSNDSNLTGAEMFFVADKPIGNPNYRSDDTSGLGCRNNPDYFKVMHFYISLNSDDTDHHDFFWKKLGFGLSTIK